MRSLPSNLLFYFDRPSDTERFMTNDSIKKLLDRNVEDNFTQLNKNSNGLVKMTNHIGRSDHKAEAPEFNKWIFRNNCLIGYSRKSQSLMLRILKTKILNSLKAKLKIL